MAMVRSVFERFCPRGEHAWARRASFCLRGVSPGARLCPPCQL